MHDLPKATLEKYFYAGFEYKTIVLLLEKHHSVKASVRTIRRVLGSFGLKRRGQSVDIDESRNRINEGRNGRASLLHELDPEASHERHRRRLTRRTYFSCGPNFS